MLKVMALLSRAMAIVGGVALLALVGVTCVSILGRAGNTLAHWPAPDGPLAGLGAALRALDLGPVTGDFELVSAGIAFAVFAFLPICQIQSGHAVVDVFTSRLPGRANAWLVALWEVLLAAAIVLIAWRLSVGMTDKMRYGETTFLLQFPVWWAFAASLGAATVAAVVALWCAWARLVEAATGRAVLPRAEGAPH